MMEIFKFYLLPSLVNFVGIIYVQHLVLNQKVYLNKSRVYVGLITFLIFNILGYIYVDGFLRMVTNTLLIIFVSWIVFNNNINKTVGAVIIEQVIYFFSELFVAIVLNIFKVSSSTIQQNYFSFLLVNVIISIISIILCKINLIKKVVNKLLNMLNSITSMKKYILILFLFITLNFLIMIIYYEPSNKYILIINFGFIIMYSALNEKSENVKYKEQNKMLIDNLNEYEKMLDYQRVNNHENKNQLLVIQGMIDKTNTKALEYLDEIIKEKREDDEGIYTSASIIPQGGLQGLVYQKMLKMKENNITINLKVERKVRKINLDNLPSKTNYDLCRAVGIIIDNAIEENLNLKEREILICMYILDEYLVIEVSNKCSVIPDMTRLDEKGYTTKSNGHGYGLSLLKEIVDSNKNIINERSINKDIFTQIIKIKK